MPRKRSEHDCIDPKHVPCEKARTYLAKHGKLCGVAAPKPEKSRRKKGFLEEWF